MQCVINLFVHTDVPTVFLVVI